MTATFDSELRQQEHEFNLKLDEMHAVVLSHELKVRRVNGWCLSVNRMCFHSSTESIYVVHNYQVCIPCWIFLLISNLPMASPFTHSVVIIICCCICVFVCVSLSRWSCCLKRLKVTPWFSCTPQRFLKHLRSSVSVYKPSCNTKSRRSKTSLLSKTTGTGTPVLCLCVFVCLHVFKVLFSVSG